MKFKIKIFPCDKSVVTFFEDNTCSVVKTNEDHNYHAKLFDHKINAFKYNVIHELAHHLIGIHVFKQHCSNVIWRSAHHLPMIDPARMLEEWYTTVITYHAYGIDQRSPDDYGALIDIARQTSVTQLANKLVKEVDDLIHNQQIRLG